MSFSIQIVAFCKRGDLPEAEASRFIRLLKPYSETTCVHLKPPAGSFANKNELMEAEARIVLARIPGKSCLVALSEEGKSLGASHSFAGWLSGKQRQGRPLIFAIGGAYGIARSLKQTAQEVISLSPLTLSHGLAQLVLLEQIYRAFTILKGHPYHK